LWSKDLLTDEKVLDMRTLKIAAALLLYFNISSAPSLAQSTTPVVFIPGFAGSYLCEKAGNKARVWPGKMDPRKIRLPMDVNLDPNSLEHEACGVVRESIRLGGFRVADVYGDFVGYLQGNLGNGVKVLEFSYDWRLSVEHNARELRAYLDRELPGSEVDIVAHSFGGLIARYFIQNLRGENRVHQLITLGTPYRGSTNTFYTLYDGWGGGEGLKDKAINWWMGTAELRKSLLSFPGFYDMLPSYPNCCWFSPDTQFNAFDVKAWSRFSFYTEDFPGPQEQTFLESQLKRALELHRSTLSVGLPGRHRREQLSIVTGLIDTVTRVYVDARTGERLPYERKEGDGTVPLNSAIEGRKEGDRAFRFSPAEHMRIFNEKSAKETVVRTLRNRDVPTAEDSSAPSYSILTRDNKSLGLRSLGYEVTPGAVGPGDTVRLTVWLKGDAGLSTADISNLSAKISTPIETELALKSEDSAQAEAGTRTLIADFAAPNAAGAYTVRITIPGLGEDHKDVEGHNDVFIVVEK
jgi:pimeloyl-ACP methyl ester carboxylesterase